MNTPDDDLVKELYARFGLAYYQSECLHKNLCNAYVLAPFEAPDGITGPRVDERMAEAFAMTLGQLVEAVRSWVPSDLQEPLAQAVGVRNYLAHRFWFERIHLALSETGVNDLIEELMRHHALFAGLDEALHTHFSQQCRSLGVTDELCQKALRELLEQPTEWDAPLSQRRLRKQELIVRIWDAPVLEEQSTIIFELEDGTLWQLADVGLGWTRFTSPGSDWRENASLKPYLPARTNPRPGVPGSWQYELGLSGGARIAVRLSTKRARAFVWRLLVGEIDDRA